MITFRFKIYGLPENTKTDTIRDISARLFWFQTFGVDTEVPWCRFRTAFGSNYVVELLEATSMINLRSRLLKCSDADPPDSEGTITMTMLDKFVSPPGVGLLQRFQQLCDPGTLLLCVGDIYPDSDHHHGMFDRTSTLQEQPGVVGEHIVQVRCGRSLHAIICRLEGQGMSQLSTMSTQHIAYNYLSPLAGGLRRETCLGSIRDGQGIFLGRRGVRQTRPRCPRELCQPCQHRGPALHPLHGGTPLCVCVCAVCLPAVG